NLNKAVRVGKVYVDSNRLAGQHGLVDRGIGPEQQLVDVCVSRPRIVMPWVEPWLRRPLAAHATCAPPPALRPPAVILSPVRRLYHSWLVCALLSAQGAPS